VRLGTKRFRNPPLCRRSAVADRRLRQHEIRVETSNPVPTLTRSAAGRHVQGGRRWRNCRWWHTWSCGPQSCHLTARLPVIYLIKVGGPSRQQTAPVSRGPAMNTSENSAGFGAGGERRMQIKSNWRICGLNHMSENLPVILSGAPRRDGLEPHGATYGSHQFAADRAVGERNARRAGQAVERTRFCECLHESIAARAVRTCELAGFGAVAEVDPNLVEWNTTATTKVFERWRFMQ